MTSKPGYQTIVIHILPNTSRIKGNQAMKFSHSWMIREEINSSSYNLLPDQISLSGCLYFVRYWAISVLQLFVNEVVTS